MIPKNINRLLFLAVFFAISISFAYSQNMRDREKFGEDKRWDRIEEFKKLKMIEELNLNEDESVKFYVKYNNLTNQFREIEKERRKSISDLEKILNDPNKISDLEKQIEYIEGLEQKLLSNRMGFMSEIKKILSIDKVARYIIFERNFQRELQKIVKDARKPPFDR